jgi:hypothetical protein
MYSAISATRGTRAMVALPRSAREAATNAQPINLKTFAFRLDDPHAMHKHH